MRDDQVYAPCFPVACCPVNSVAIVPEFIRGMILKGDAKELCFMAYGPCTLNSEGISLKVDTMYPFRNKVNIDVEQGDNLKIKLRIPSWSIGYTIAKNGEACNGDAKDGFALVTASSGDKIELNFEAKVQIVTVDDTDASGKMPLAVRYGALLFSYHIPEIWEQIEGRPMTKLPDGWSWYNVNPDFVQPDKEDIHERNGLLKYAFSWNIALDENISADDFAVENTENGGYVWANAPIKLHAHCYKAPDMWAPYQCKTHEPYGKYQSVTEKLPLTLEPYGCTNLRITYFPRANPEDVGKLN